MTQNYVGGYSGLHTMVELQDSVGSQFQAHGLGFPTPGLDKCMALSSRRVLWSWPREELSYLEEVRP